MKGLLVRVAADQSKGGGSWNGPAEASTGNFAYVAIPEEGLTHPGLAKPFALVKPAVASFGAELPTRLAQAEMHLDPDFEHLTYGDQGARAKQIRTKLSPGDLLVFYAGLRDIGSSSLTYGVIGLYVIERIDWAAAVPSERWHENAHTRRLLPANASDIVVVARAGESGRLERYLPIGAYRERAYRVRAELLDEWGGLSVRDGYLQRSARLPELLDAPRFLRWFRQQGVALVQRNN